MPQEKTILIADDDHNDIILLRRAFEKAGLSVSLAVVSDGQQAKDYLAGVGIYSDRSLYPWPALMLLDLKMPRVDGFDVLAWLQTQVALPKFPIVVLSSSGLEPDVERALDLGADDYCVKPARNEFLVQLAREYHERWLSADKAPS